MAVQNTEYCSRPPEQLGITKLLRYRQWDIVEIVCATSKIYILKNIFNIPESFLTEVYNSMILAYLQSCAIIATT